jgi:hypothetical protein
MNQESILRSALSDILKGFSFYHPKGLYIKHLCLDDYVDYERIYENHYERLRKKGVETKDQLLSRAIKNKLWDEERENEIEDLKEEIETNKTSIEKCPVAEMRQDMEKSLKENEQRYYLLLATKESFIAPSCEKLTDKKMNEHYVVSSLFKDPNFKEPYLSAEEIEDTDTDFGPFIRIYNELSHKCSIENIKKIAIQDFFRGSWGLAKNPYYYFGKPISQITYNQTHLANYAQVFDNIFENYPDIDSTDPDEIIKFAKIRQETDKKGGNRTFVGMSNEEAQRMGLKQPERKFD